jgi:hypothetical protein
MLSAALGDAAFQSLPENWRWMVGAPLVPALLLTCEGRCPGVAGIPTRELL